jgi:hypothetical protein
MWYGYSLTSYDSNSTGINWTPEVGFAAVGIRQQRGTGEVSRAGLILSRGIDHPSGFLRVPSVETFQKGNFHDGFGAHIISEKVTTHFHLLPRSWTMCFSILTYPIHIYDLWLGHRGSFTLTFIMSIQFRQHLRFISRDFCHMRDSHK